MSDTPRTDRVARSRSEIASTTVVDADFARTLERELAQAKAEAEQNKVGAWVYLTDEDRRAAFESLPDALEGFLKKWGWLHFAKEIERRCMEKNAAIDAARQEGK